MSLALELQNPYDYNNLPNTETLQIWADAGLQATDDTNYVVVLRVVNEDEGRQLNREFRGKDYATNVLSFPFDTPPAELLDELEEVPLGDLVICEPVLTKEAAEQGKSVSQHLAHLLIHGLLHLQGFDHISDEDAETMEALEVKLLGKLGFENPYLT